MFNLLKLKGRIVEKSLNGKELAKLIGCSHITMYDKLNGKIEFSRAEIEGICKILEINPLDYFFDL